MLSNNPEETREIAAEFVRHLPARAVVGLVGPLGAGKTVFIQGMAAGLGIEPEAYVTSPTFALIHEYVKKGAASPPSLGEASSTPTLIHFDLYRLRSFDELLDIGLEEYAERPGICVLEWVDRFSELKSYLTHRVEIEIVGETSRRISIAPSIP